MGAEGGRDPQSQAGAADLRAAQTIETCRDLVAGDAPTSVGAHAAGVDLKIKPLL